MEALVQAIQKQSDSKENLEKLVKKFDGSTKLIKKNIGHIDTILRDYINPIEHTYGYLRLLSFKASTEYKNHSEFIEQARGLCLQGDGHQLRMAGRDFANVCHKLAVSLIISEKSIRGVLPLEAAVQKLRGPDPNLLTPAHADFVQICLKAKCYDKALQIINTPIYKVDPKANGLEPLDFLQYFYYSGICFVGLKKFPQALEAFQMALTIPSTVLSAVQVEAFKKYVLVSLLVHGELIPLPHKITSSVVSRNADRLSGAYIEVARAFKRGVDALAEVIDDHKEAFKKDNNMGLVKQTMKALVRRNIQRLTSTYVTLSLSDLAARANLSSPQEAEEYVLHMISDGDLHARISQRDGMLSFLENPELYDTSEQAARMDSKIREVVALSKQLKSVDREIILNPMYVSKTMPREERGGGGGGGAEERELKMALAQSMMS